LLCEDTSVVEYSFNVFGTTGLRKESCTQISLPCRQRPDGLARQIGVEDVTWIRWMTLGEGKLRLQQLSTPDLALIISFASKRERLIDLSERVG
jgi:hypothetical protein